MDPTNRSASDREKGSVALASLLAAVLLTGLKLAVGVLSGSLGILSEAAHSALDLAAAAMTLWAVRVSSKPADRQHTYGHGKVENLSALGETLLLLGTCVWIIYESMERLFIRPAVVDASPWAFVVMLLSIAIDFSRSRALSRVAKKYGSQALEADALHFSTDIWSSSVVIVGLALVYLSHRLGLPWLEKADAVAALGVAAIVVWVSLQLGKKSVDDLLDAIPDGVHDEVKAAARVAGVVEVRRVRIRRSGPAYFADVALVVGRDAVLERAHDIATAAEVAVRGVLPDSDVVVHVEPAEPGSEGILETLRLLAARRSLAVHGISVYGAPDALSVEMHVEVKDSLTLQEAHEEVSRFEQHVRRTLPRVADIVTHIEPAGEASSGRLQLPVDDVPVRKALDALRSEGLVFEVSALSVRRVGGELNVSFNVAIHPQLSIADAHALTERLEKGLRQKIADLGRVVIHAEPLPDCEAPA